MTLEPLNACVQRHAATFPRSSDEKKKMLQLQERGMSGGWYIILYIYIYSAENKQGWDEILAAGTGTGGNLLKTLIVRQAII